ncbi:FtsK/SpoIIIE domain-containing protein [Actinomadura chokoriensis]|uniref:FtsK/SpoIIIE domain-containing protein n=1 Tax=Actinomadura chokoriensis TaxID=454156 RepID=A0ABV4R930_9ACTN
MALPDGHTADVVQLHKPDRAAAVVDTDTDDTEEVLEGEIVPAAAGPVNVRPDTLTEMTAAARMAGYRAMEIVKRPDLVAAAVLRHELRYGVPGALRCLGMFWSWVCARELDAQLASNPRLVLDVRQTRKKAAAGTAATVAAGGAASWVLLSPLVPVAGLLLVLALTGAAERRYLASLRGGADTGRKALGTHPGSKAVRRAVADAKLGKADDIRVIGPITRVAGAWEAMVELPAGTTAKHAAKRRAELASSIGVDVVQLAVDPVKGHAGRIGLWVADTDPMQGDAVTSPLVNRRDPVDFWTGRVFAGRDARGRAVEFSLVERSYLIGGEPGGGKSVAANNVLAFAALDPYVELWLADGKGGFDLADWEPVAHRVLERPEHGLIMSMVADLQEEMARRYALLRKAGERKLTRDVAARLGLHPIVFHVDEIQKFSLGDGDAKQGKEFITGIADLVGRGRAAGMITGTITQRPAADVVPTRLRDILSIRWALRCTTPDASDTILGSGRAGQGYSAAVFDATQRGAGYVLAEGADPVQTRSAYLSDDEVAGIARRAYALREEAGTLPATADRPDVRLLTAVLDAMGRHPKGAHTAEMLPALTQRPEFGGWDAAKLAGALKPLGVTPRQVDLDGRNRNGYRRDDVTSALDRL